MSEAEAEAEAEPDPDGAYDRLRRRVLWSMPTGLFVVGSRHGDRRNLMTANWVMQVATAPKLVAVAVESTALTRQLIELGGRFSVSILPQSERAVIRKFVKPVRDVVLDSGGVATSLQREPVHEVLGGLPCLSSALSWLSCEVRSTHRWDAIAGSPASHVLFVGEVVAVGESETEGHAGGEVPAVLEMRDTRMNYGG
jgi:flavin reductase (DIM6/NTAB) family NADH-FMN oxidoreductase RutF